MENKERGDFMIILLISQHLISKKHKILASILFSASQPHIWDFTEDRGSKEAWWSLSSCSHILPPPHRPKPTH